LPKRDSLLYYQPQSPKEEGMSQSTLDQALLDTIFPASRADAFFDALFGGAEEGAYDIRLVCRSVEAEIITLAFELHQRAGKCLACNLTYGLPQVFQRHPVLQVGAAARAVAQAAGWDADAMRWELGRTQEHSRELHSIAFILHRA
jgi:hypothetical protein